MTLAATALLGVRATGLLRLWSPLVSVLLGCGVAALFGLYDAQLIPDASWIGVAELWFPGLDLTPGNEFWSLLPMFLIVAMASTIKTLGSNVVMQRVSRREQKATDYRLVQGSVNANAVGTLISGIAGILPPGSYEATTASLTRFTGVATRRVGYIIGIMLVALAFSPKLMAPCSWFPTRWRAPSCWG